MTDATETEHIFLTLPQGTLKKIEAKGFLNRQEFIRCAIFEKLSKEVKS